MNALYLKPTATASLAALTLYLASVAPISAQAPSYPIGQGPFGQPQVQQPAQPSQSLPADQTRAPGQYRTPQGPARGWGQQQGGTQAQAPAMAPVQVASQEAAALSLAALADKPIRNAAQEVLGTLTDFLIDPRTGKIEFAVVPSGVDAAGETYRLIPVAVLDPASGAEGLRAQISTTQWHQVESIPDQQLRGNVSLNPARRQRLNQQFGITSYNNNPGMSSALVRISELRGKTLQTWGRQLGVVKDVAIDIRHQMAAALVNPTDPAVGSDQTFLVSFPQLQIGQMDQSAINTALTPAHFQEAQSATPTGLSGSNAFGEPAVMAVRRALDQDPSLARASVQIVPETRIRLHGTVESEQVRSNIERTAKAAAPGVQVDNHITVQRANR